MRAYIQTRTQQNGTNFRFSKYCTYLHSLLVRNQRGCIHRILPLHNRRCLQRLAEVCQVRRPRSGRRGATAELSCRCGPSQAAWRQWWKINELSRTLLLEFLRSANAQRQNKTITAKKQTGTKGMMSDENRTGGQANDVPLKF